MHARSSALVLALCLLAAHGCSRPAPQASAAATNTYLRCVARDLLGGEHNVMCLAGAGMCPGHFDIRPGQVDTLRRCRVLLRFDFQTGIDSKLTRAMGDGLRVASIAPGGGLCVPGSYAKACRDAADALVSAGLLSKRDAEARLAEVRQRMDALAAWAHARIKEAGLAGHPILAAQHQAGFCRWLGLNVVGDFPGGDTTRFGELNDAVQAGRSAAARLVIANRPAGRSTADKLAGTLGAAVVVFDNFPQPPAAESFDDLVRHNVEALVSAAKN